MALSVSAARLLLVVAGAHALRAPPTMGLGRKAVVAPPAKRTFGRLLRKAPAVAPVAVAAPPLLPAMGAACVLPTCLGFWKREYGVS